METFNQEPINEVLSNYNLNVLSVKNEVYKGKKGVWWIYTSSGEKVLKKVSNSEATLRFILSGVNYLIDKGVKIPRIVKTKTGMDYVKIDKTCFVMSEAIKGQKLNCETPRELEIVARELGKFHKASYGFDYPYGAKPKNHLGTWIEEYTSYLEDMNKFYILEKEEKTHNPIGNLILQEFPYFYERGKKSIEALKGKEYHDFVIKINNKGCLCHQDFSPANVLFTESGLYVLDTDSIAIDLPVRDIRKLLNKLIKKTGRWNAETVQNILSWYNEENPLTPVEWRVVIFDLMFPHLFLGAMDKYCYRRDKTWTDVNYYNRIKEMAAFEKTITPIIQNANNLISNITKNPK